MDILTERDMEHQMTYLSGEIEGLEKAMELLDNILDDEHSDKLDQYKQALQDAKKELRHKREKLA